MRQAAGMRDKSGSTIADYYMGIAMGGPNPGAPPMPVAGGAGWIAEMNALLAARPKTGYSLITKHLSSPDELKIVGHGTIYFQNGLLTLQHLDAKYNTAMRNTEVRKLESAWTALSILAEVGINEESISRSTSRTRRSPCFRRE